MQRSSTSLYSLLILTAAVAATGCDDYCGDSSCRFTDAEWTRISSLANLGEPALDPVNKYAGVQNTIAEVLGQKFYFDRRFSGISRQKDTLGRFIGSGRAPLGEETNVACADCHDPRIGGADHTSSPGHVSVGAGWYDVNAQATVNSAYYKVKYWNGRYDSLVWQILAVNESGVSQNSTRLKDAWLIHDLYLDDYNQVFGADHPFPFDYRADGITRDVMVSMMEPDGTCALVDTSTTGAGPGECPTMTASGAPLCRIAVADDMREVCLPVWPVSGKPGNKLGDKDKACNLAAFAPGTNLYADTFDAFDCMLSRNQSATTRVYVNFAKAIGAYEYRLVSKNAPFDKWVNEGPSSDIISAAARRGARLFVGKAACIDCHNTPLLSDDLFHNIGVPQIGAAVPTEADCPQGAACDCVTKDSSSCKAWGAFGGLQKLQAGADRGDKCENEYVDTCDDTRDFYYDLTVKDELKGAWRTPSLRSVALTEPYMHSGSITTLQDVVEHYNYGGTRDGAATDYISPRIAPLGLSNQEILDLVAFMESLTGETLPISLITAPVLPE